MSENKDTLLIHMPAKLKADIKRATEVDAGPGEPANVSRWVRTQLRQAVDKVLEREAAK